MAENTSTEKLINHYKEFLEKVYGKDNMGLLAVDFEKFVQEYQAWLKHLTFSGTEQWKKGQDMLYKFIDFMFTHLPKK